MNHDGIEQFEIYLLLETIFVKYGYDFRRYASPIFKKRILQLKKELGLLCICELTKELLHKENVWPKILEQFSISVTEMFRDPEFYLDFRLKVLPILRTYPRLRIWHAGCATGEEVYSLAIMLEEENLLERTVQYATDISQGALNMASCGLYQSNDYDDISSKYKKTGGKKSLSKFISITNGTIKIKEQIKKNIIFSKHNLVSDQVFNEMNVIICRNVLIYFENDLQKNVIELFKRSLMPNGFLCLGPAESLQSIGQYDDFNPISLKWNIYKNLTRIVKI